MATTPQDLADALTAAQGPAEDTAKQDEANLAIATGIWNFLTTKLKVKTGIQTAGSETSQVTITEGELY